MHTESNLEECNTQMHRLGIRKKDQYNCTNFPIIAAAFFQLLNIVDSTTIDKYGSVEKATKMQESLILTRNSVRKLCH